MMPLSIGSATEVYGNASRCEIIRHWIDHPELSGLSRSLRALVNSRADDASDEYWRQMLGPLRKLAFAFCSVPLPFAEAVKATGTDWNKIHRNVRRCEQTYPDSYKLLTSVAEKLEQLSAGWDSPLIPALEGLVQGSASLSVVIRNPRMNKATATYLASNPKLRNARVVSAAQLRGPHVSDVLATIGPCAWFPEYVFLAPRAGAIHVISFRWISDQWKPAPIFLHNSETVDGGTNRYYRMGALPRVSGDSAAGTEVSSDILPGDLLPPLPVFTHRANKLTDSHSSNGQELIPARLCHVSGNRAVFVAADEGAKSLIIDTSETGRASVRRSYVEELELGFYLLLRTSGGGDFIAPLADRMLGDKALILRSKQVEWKRELIAKALDRFGPSDRRNLASQVAAELRSQQLSQARSANVHYWMSAKCISPRKPEDFAAIMSFAGLEDRTKELSAAMVEISAAHTRAGFLIRRMLLKKITEASLEPLERDGEMDFDLGEHDGGTLSAYQIVAIQDEDFEIPVDQIGVLLETED